MLFHADLHRLKAALSTCPRKHKPETALLTAQFALSLILSALLSLAPQLIPVRISLFIFGLVLFAVTTVFLDYDRVTQPVLAPLLANLISFILLIFDARFYCVLLPLWTVILWPLTAWLGTSAPTTSKPQLLLSRSSSLQVEDSFYASSSVPQAQLKRYLYFRALLLDSTVLTTILNITPEVLPPMLVPFLSFLGLSQQATSTFYLTCIFELYLFNSAPPRLWQLVRYCLFAVIIGCSVQTIGALLSFLAASFFMTILKLHFAHLWQPLLIGLCVHIAFKLSLELVSPGLLLSFHFQLLNGAELFLTALLLSALWNPPKLFLFFYHALVYLLLLYCGLQPLYLLCELLDAQSYESLTLFLTWDLPFTLSRKLILLSLLILYLLLVEFFTEDEPAPPPPKQEKDSSDTIPYLDRAYNRLQHVYNGSWARARDHTARYKKMLQTWRNYLTVALFFLSLVSFPLRWIKIATPFILLLVSAEMKLAVLYSFRHCLFRKKNMPADLESDQGLQMWAFYTLASLSTLGVILLRSFFYETQIGMMVNLGHWGYRAAVPLQYQIIFDYIFEKTEGSAGLDNVWLEVGQWVCVVLPGLALTLVEVTRVGSVFSERLLMFIFPVNFLVLFLAESEALKLTVVVLGVAQGWLALKQLIENDNLQDEDQEKSLERKKESRGSRPDPWQQAGAMMNPLGMGLGGFARSY